MANQEHLDILAEGVEAWNEWRKKNPDVRPDLIGAHLSNANLRDADFGGANLSGARLDDANLVEAQLISANLRSASLIDARLTRAYLNDADLHGAELSGCDLTEAILNGTDLSGAIVWCTSFANVDLSGTKGLDAVDHHGPSSIGVDTIYRSQGKISESFLCGAGVPENFIVYMKSLTGAAFEFYSCFISHSTIDQAFADRLYADLQARGVRCWFAPHDIQGGRKLHEQIDEAIRVYGKLLLILSDASMNSAWVKTEIANVRAREEQQKRQMLFPITVVPFDRIKDWKLFDADRGIDSAREIREYFIPDFSNWKDHDSYHKAFDRLVRDLKAEGKDRAGKLGLDVL
jgi:uncharacterized protein YjbI with pentapeptide repeats